MSKIMVDNNIPNFVDLFPDLKDQILVFDAKKLTNSMLRENYTQALICRSTLKVNRELLENTDVKFVGTATAGVNHIDLQFLAEKNIKFCSAAGSNANSVAEYVVQSILLFYKWRNESCKDKKIAIIGYGNIGKRLAKYVNLLDMIVYVNDPPLKESGFVFPSYCNHIEFESIDESFDVVTNHVPLTFSGKYQTYQILNEDFFNRLKQKSLFIHASRGGVVDESALKKYAKIHSLTAVIDVWEKEPEVDLELVELSNILTPHSAGHSQEAKMNGTLMMAKALAEFLGIYYNIEAVQVGKFGTNKIDYQDIQPQNLLVQLLKKRDLMNESHIFKTELSSNPNQSSQIFKQVRESKIKRFELFKDII